MSGKDSPSTDIRGMSKGRKALAQGGAVLIVMLVIAGGLVGVAQYQLWILSQPHATLERFDTCSGIVDAFNRSSQAGLYRGWGVLESLGEAAPMAATSDAAGGAKTGDYSTTNIQVEGVDEADIVKSDGYYIYAISGSTLVIMDVHDPEEAEVLSETELGDFTPSEMLIKDDMLMLFGYSREIAGEYPVTKTDQSGAAVDAMIAPEMDYYYPYYRSFTTVQLWDISDRKDPEKEREVDFEGSYVSSRMIGDDVYFVINSYPDIYPMPGNPVDVLPAYRDSQEGDELVPVCGCTSVGYFEPGYAQSFITLASMSISDPDADIEKEVVVGSGENIYASQDNIYIAEYDYSWLFRAMPLLEAVDDITVDQIPEPKEQTIVHKFSLEGGKIEYLSNAVVPGRVLNQFSMDEHDGYFRIATTSGRVTRSGGVTSNDVYIYDDDMELTGSLTGLAPGESIYSVRFMGDRGYMVTFVKIDPLFVIDLSDPENPEVLGKLKIPGYSDYLHPYDEDHIIGIGKDVDAASEEQGDFAWYQGVKMALFDVSDVENPKELHKVVIGDRGTDSYALHDHKAFLFDREKELLVIPILLAEFSGDPEDLPDWSYGDYVYQGAYVYRLSLDDGFELQGRITHFDDDDIFKKSGYYFYDGTYSVKRSGYIENVLWTLSQNRLKLNQLSGLDELATLDFGDPEDSRWYGIETAAVDAPAPDAKE